MKLKQLEEERPRAEFVVPTAVPGHRAGYPLYMLSGTAGEMPSMRKLCGMSFKNYAAMTGLLNLAPAIRHFKR